MVPLGLPPSRSFSSAGLVFSGQESSGFVEALRRNNSPIRKVVPEIRIKWLALFVSVATGREGIRSRSFEFRQKLRSVDSLRSRHTLFRDA